MFIVAFLVCLLAVFTMYGFCYLVSLLFQKTTNPKTRISLHYFVHNSHKFSKSDLDHYVRTNFGVTAEDGMAMVLDNNNYYTHLAGMLEVLNRGNIPNHAYIYDPPIHITNKLSIRHSA